MSVKAGVPGLARCPLTVGGTCYANAVPGPAVGGTAQGGPIGATNTPERSAGTWTSTQSGAGGPVINVQFDASLIED